MDKRKNDTMRNRALDAAERGKLSNAYSFLWHDIAKETGIDEDILKEMLDFSGINLLDLFPDDYGKRFRKAIIDAITEGNYTPDQIKDITDKFGIQLTPSELIHMTFPDGFKDDTALANEWAEQFTKQKPTFSLIYTPSADDTVYDWETGNIASGDYKTDTALANKWAEQFTKQKPIFSLIYTPPVDDTVYDWETGNIASGDYKTDWDRFVEQEPSIEDVELDIEFDDDSIRELREKILEALGDDIIDDSERKPLIDLYGEDMYYMILDEVNDGLDSASMTRLQRMAASGVLGGNRTVSDVGWTPRNIGSVFASQAESDADMQKILSTGTKDGTQDMLSVLRDLLAVTQAINRKDFTVTITPTSTLGAAMTRSVGMYDRITG
jgi:hypothetical protein